ncbi:unnamed protein product [Rhodiola kirilowii]
MSHAGSRMGDNIVDERVDDFVNTPRIRLHFTMTPSGSFESAIASRARPRDEIRERPRFDTRPALGRYLAHSPHRATARSATRADARCAI